MNKKYSVALAIIGFSMLIAGSAGTAFAAQKKGDMDLQVSGGFFHAQGAESGFLSLDLGFGYYVTESLELGILQTLGYAFIDDADDLWTGSTIPFVNYYFRGLTENDTFQPFVGAFIGASYNEYDTTGTVGPQVGFKSYITDNTYFMAKYRYEWFFNELTINEIDNSSSDGNHVVTFGIGFVF